jgi:hypothetical protein
MLLVSWILLNDSQLTKLMAKDFLSLNIIIQSIMKYLLQNNKLITKIPPLDRVLSYFSLVDIFRPISMR